MTDRPEIEPALSVAEWNDNACIVRAGTRIESASSALMLDNPDEYGSICVVDFGALPSLIARSNYALPDDSPYKITHADVEALRQLDAFTVTPDAHVAKLLALAAKLAALLPPVEAQ